MVRFISEVIVLILLLLVATLPLSWVIRKQGIRRSTRRWRLMAVVFGIIAAGFGWSSRDLEQRCLDAGNDNCLDIGSTGMQFVVVGGFIAAALIAALLLHND